MFFKKTIYFHDTLLICHFEFLFLLYFLGVQLYESAFTERD